MKSSKSNNKFSVPQNIFFEASTLRLINHVSLLIWTALRLHDAL